MHEENGRIVETAIEARAGFLDRPTLAVLIVSTALLIGLFAVTYIGFFPAVISLGGCAIGTPPQRPRLRQTQGIGSVKINSLF
jgi:hypothetical protein